MFSKISFLLIAWLIALPVLSSPPDVVYRAVMEDPDVVKQQGGFLPRGMDGSRPNQPPPDTSLFNHAQGASTGLANHSSGYVSTTTSLTTAHYWVNNNLAGLGYIYHIHPTGNFIDVNASLLGYSPYPAENEYAALGAVRWSQIVGWQHVNFGVLGDFVPNRDYNRRLYSTAHAGEGAPYLAGFPRDHRAWSEPPWVQFSSCPNSRSRMIPPKDCGPHDSSFAVAYKHFLKHEPVVMVLAID